MTLWDWLFELQQNWKVVLFGIQSVNKADVSCVHVYACVSAFSFFFFFFLFRDIIVRKWRTGYCQFNRCIGVTLWALLQRRWLFHPESGGFSLFLTVSIIFPDNIWRHILADNIPQRSIRSVALDFTCFLIESVLSLPKLNTVGYFECRLSSRNYAGLANLMWFRL